ncbi:MAG: hypothetical protein HXK71_06820, partial [Clostridiales bacterium]|nr:hypothetical protein [Clostridiales bacterium]
KWLDDSNIDVKQYLDCTKYVIDSSGVEFSNGMKGINVMEFVKDAYGKPYVPGSSIKGMLRTILLSGRIWANKKILTFWHRISERTAMLIAREIII